MKLMMEIVVLVPIMVLAMLLLLNWLLVFNLLHMVCHRKQRKNSNELLTHGGHRGRAQRGSGCD